MFCLGVSAIAIVLSCWPDGLACFRYERTALLSGKVWRIMTAHFVHMNATHLAFNVLGMFLLCELLWGDMPVVHGLGLFGMAALAVSALLWWLQPELAWYAGLSGALHGLWAGCAVAGSWPGKKHSGALPLTPPQSKWQFLLTAWPLARCICFAGLMLIVMKLAVEFQSGVALRTAPWIGGSVVTVAHLYGALAGIVYVLLWRVAQEARGKT